MSINKPFLITYTQNLQAKYDELDTTNHNTEISRAEATSKVLAYIRKENLQNPVNKRQILLNDKLNKLLKPPVRDIVTFFNLHTYLKKHFISKY